MTKALHRAKTDDKIKGLLVRTGFGMVPASAEEIRLAMLDFKDSGKFIIRDLAASHNRICGDRFEF